MLKKLLKKAKGRKCEKSNSIVNDMCKCDKLCIIWQDKKEIRWKEEEKPSFNDIKVTIKGEEKYKKVIPGKYLIKIFQIHYPTDLFGKNKFYNDFNKFLKTVNNNKKYSLLLEKRFYDEMQDLKDDQLSEEENLGNASFIVDEYYRQQLVGMSKAVTMTQYAGTDQEYLNRQIYVLYQLLDRKGFDANLVYSELDKEFLIAELKTRRKEVVENFEKKRLEYFIKETYEDAGLDTYKDDSVYKFDKDIVISKNIEEQAIFPDVSNNLYITGFPKDIIEGLAKNKLKLKRRVLVLENSEYHGYTYNENNTVVFVNGEKPKYYYKDYQIDVVMLETNILDLLRTSSNYYVSDFF